jgi:hypothetical protein
LTSSPGLYSVEAVPDRLTESYERLLLALEQLLREAQRVGDAGVREWASLAAIDFAEELGMMGRVQRLLEKEEAPPRDSAASYARLGWRCAGRAITQVRRTTALPLQGKRPTLRATQSKRAASFAWLRLPRTCP